MNTKPIAVPAQQMWSTWEEGDKQGMALAMAQTAKGLKATEPVLRAHGSNIFQNIAPGNVSVRDGMNRFDYDLFRRGEAIPIKPRDVMSACMSAYKRIGIIRNIIDLMADFATQGIDLNHPNERIEKWYKEWFRRVGGKERSERFVNLLYRCGNVIVQRHTAKIPVKVEDEMRRAQAKPDIKIDDEVKLDKREIPWKYVFRNPLTTDVICEELSAFVGHESFSFCIQIPRMLIQKVMFPKTENEKKLVAALPETVRQGIKDGLKYIPLDSDKVRSFYYKRDDWEVWASPMTYAILPDLQMLQKMKLADLAALDGAISCIRVWRLGNIEARIMPTEAALNRLAEMLCNNVGGGVMDLVWGPEIDLVETKTDVHKFLGETKYIPVLTSIYAGLGIPPTLTGADSAGGFTNNFISLKTLTERLEYGRGILASFWEEEIRIVQKSMGFRFPASLVFDRMTLTDEAAEKQLLINLADRDLISVESLQERFGETPEIESVRLRRELRKRRDGLMPPKAGPFHSAEQDFEFKKIFATQGTVTPSELGVELDERDSDEKPLLDQQNDQQNKQTRMQVKQQGQQNDHEFRTEKLQLKHGVHPNQLQQGTPGQPGQGRPKQSKDSGPRKQKTVSPRTSAVFFQTMAWAENAQAKIGTLSSPAYLGSLSKKNLRELTDDEQRNFESFKFHALCQLEPNTEVEEDTVKKIVGRDLGLPVQVSALLRATVTKHAEAHGREPNLETLRRYQAGAYTFWKGGFEEEEAAD